MNSKISVLAMVALSASLLTSCKKDVKNGPDSPDVKGNTYAGLVIAQRGDLRVTDNQNDYSDRTADSGLETLDLISSVKNQSWTFSQTADQAGTFWKANGDLYTVSPWETRAGAQQDALIINKGDLAVNIGTAKEMVYGAAGKEKDNITALSTDNKYVMTSTIKSLSVNNGITEAAVKAGTDETKNVFAFDVERVVCRGLVVKGKGLKKETTDGKGEINLDNLTYAAVNGAVKTYVFGENAGSRTIGIDGLYEDYKSAIDGVLSSDFKGAMVSTVEAVKNNLVRLGNIGTSKTVEAPADNNALGAYAAISVYANEDAAKKDKGILFMENSVEKGASWTATNKDYGFYRLAYAKVYATFKPKTVYKLDNATKKLVVDDAFASGTTFYMGVKDGLFYASKEAAAASQIAPNQEAYCYTKGRCAYRALWNRQVNKDATVASGDTRRNNIYLLTIQDFSSVGMPYDPSDPNDPNLPKSGVPGKPDSKDKPNNPGDPTKPASDENPIPGDPNNPNSPGNPDIERQQTYMRVTAKILPWNLVTRTVSLED